MWLSDEKKRKGPMVFLFRVDARREIPGDPHARACMLFFAEKKCRMAAVHWAIDGMTRTDHRRATDRLLCMKRKRCRVQRILMATASSSSSSLTVSLFFNGAQETVALPQSGRYALPDGAIESTAVAFCVDPRDAQTSPLPFGIIRQNGPSGTHVEVTKDAVIFVGDLVSVDGDSVTLSVGSGVTQTIVGYDDLSVQRHDRPTIAIAQDLPRVCDHARVAFVRQGLSWHPSYAVYLGGNGDGDGDGADVAWIERIDIVANITNGTDQKVDAADAWAVAAHVPLPGGTAGIPRPIPQRLATTMTRSAAPMSRPPEAYAPVRDESSMMAATSAYAASGNDDDDDKLLAGRGCIHRRISGSAAGDTKRRPGDVTVALLRVVGGERNRRTTAVRGLVRDSRKRVVDTPPLGSRIQSTHSAACHRARGEFRLMWHQSLPQIMCNTQPLSDPK